MADNKGKIEEISLDASLDDIDDLPQFTVFPSGGHIVLFKSWEQKKVNGENWVNVNLELIESVEITEVIAESDKPKAGDVQTLGHNQTNAYAMGALKEFLKPIAIKLGIDLAAAGALRATLEGGVGLQLLISQNRVPAKDAQGNIKPDMYNARLKNVEVL